MKIVIHYVVMVQGVVVVRYVFLKREDDDWNGWALMKMLTLSGLCSNRRK